MTDRMTDPTTPRPDPVTAARDALERLLPDGLWAEPGFGTEFIARLDHLLALVRAEAGVSVAVEALADVRARRSTFATAEAFDSAMLEAAWNILAARSAGSGSRVGRVTHGRHCRCTPCAREDWTNPNLAPCGMHGPSCPAVYDPYPARPTPPPAPKVMVWGTGGGYGTDNNTRPTPPPATGTVERCGWCGGSGRITSGSAVCPTCHGTGKSAPTPAPEPSAARWSFEPLNGDGWAILDDHETEQPDPDDDGSWSAGEVYGNAVARTREDAVRIVNALNAAARAEGVDGLGKAAYWYFLMTQQGGPDGSDLDDAVVDDMVDELTAWAKTRDDADDYLPALAARARRTGEGA